MGVLRLGKDFSLRLRSCRACSLGGVLEKSLETDLYTLFVSLYVSCLPAVGQDGGENEGVL